MRDSHSTAVPTTARRAPAQPRWRHACCRWCRDHDVGQGQAAGSRRRSGRPDPPFASGPPVSQDGTEHRGHGGISRTRATALTWTYWTP